MSADDETRLAEIRGWLEAHEYDSPKASIQAAMDIKWLLDKLAEKESSLRVVSAASESSLKVIESLAVKVVQLDARIANLEAAARSAWHSIDGYQRIKQEADPDDASDYGRLGEAKAFLEGALK